MKTIEELMSFKSFDDLCRSLQRDKLTDEEFLESCPEARRNFILQLAEMSIDDENNCTQIAPKLIMIALYRVGHKVDLFAFGQLIGNMMVANEGKLKDSARIHNLVEKVLTFDAKEETQA